MDMRALPHFNGPPGQEDMAYLLLPGPVTTAESVRISMLADWSPDDEELKDIIRKIRQKILHLVDATEDHACVPFLGSEAAALEATLLSFAPAQHGKTLIVSNGASAELAAALLEELGRPYIKLEASAFSPFKVDDIRPLIEGDKRITHVWCVHSEIVTGVVNPVQELGALVKAADRTMLVDARHTLAAIPISMNDDNIDVLIGSSCAGLESVPGISPIVFRKQLLPKLLPAKSWSPRNLAAELNHLESSGTFRSTPTPHAVNALAEALRLLDVEGGILARNERYKRNSTEVVEGMKRMGFAPVLPEEIRGPIVQVFHNPMDASFIAKDFCALLRKRNFAVSLPSAQTFAVAVMGEVDSRVIDRFLESVEETIKDMGIRTTAPAA